MEGAISTVWLAREPEEPWSAKYAPPELDLPPCTPRGIFEAGGGASRLCSPAGEQPPVPVF